MLSIVIVSWNTAALTTACLRSIPSGAQDLDYEVIVVDNASTDGSAARIASEFPEARLVCNDANAGYARANNQGLAISTGEYVLYLNSDTVVPTGALARLVQFTRDHDSAGACGPRLTRFDGRAQPFAFGGDPTPGYLLARGAARLLLHKPLHDWETRDPKQVDWVSGASLLVRRAALDRIGGFDEHYFMYFEDNDLCMRLRTGGWQVWYDPEVAVTHLGGSSVGRAGESTRWYYDSLRYFYRKHYGPFSRLALQVLLPLYRGVSP